jgi:hypothetical protein
MIALLTHRYRVGGIGPTQAGARAPAAGEPGTWPRLDPAGSRTGGYLSLLCSDGSVLSPYFWQFPLVLGLDSVRRQLQH